MIDVMGRGCHTYMDGREDEDYGMEQIKWICSCDTDLKRKLRKRQGVFGSDRSSSSHNLRPSVHSSVRPFGSNLSRAVNLHLSRSEINQSTKRAIREH